MSTEKNKFDEINELRKKLALLEKEYGAKLASIGASCENPVIPLKKNSPQSSESKEEREYMNEVVSIRLFKDNSRYRDDLFVSVNGESCLIKRGVWVKVKRKFALVIDQSLIQDQLTGEYIDNKSREFAKESVERNI